MKTLVSLVMIAYTACTFATEPFVVVLGVAQDAGYPQTACRKECCREAWENPARRCRVACLGIVDPVSGERWIIDATQDFREQLREFDRITPPNDKNDVSTPALTGIFLTHAHIGHYTGLQDLGREVTGSKDVPVYVMPRMREFLETNGPWSQLVEQGNIELRDLADGVAVELNDRLRITPMLVPHRDEFSETVGFRIDGPALSVLYIPDIDKWELWDRSIEDEIRSVDVAYLDGTFFRDGELPGRDMSQIPHPFIQETMKRLASLDELERGKVRFLHFNHTNPLARRDPKALKEVQDAGFDAAFEWEVVDLDPIDWD